MELPSTDKEGFPTKMPFVMQWHFRGDSVHTDWRMSVGDHLVGWTVLSPGAKGLKTQFVPVAGMHGKKLQTVTKAKQPLVWIKVHGEVKPGGVGATVNESGIFKIIENGSVVFGTQKPLFHEYFLFGNKMFKDGIRVVVRGVELPLLDPQTKQPMKDKTHIVWAVWVPEDQEPYAVSNRAKEKNWKPPKNYLPFPKEWAEKNKETFAEYQKWISGVKNETLEKKQFRLFYAYWGAPERGTRGTVHEQYFLRIKSGNDIRGFIFTEENDPFAESTISMIDEGKIDKKWWEFQGKLKPGVEYNPTKSLPMNFELNDAGTLDINESVVGDRKQMTIRFAGKNLKGNWTATQEEKGSDIWDLKRNVSQLSERKFVLQKHSGPNIPLHWDLRIDHGEYLDHFHIWKDPLINIDKSHLADRVKDPDVSWISKSGSIPSGQKGGPGEVEIVDKGTVNVIDESGTFFSGEFKGSKINGYFVAIKTRLKDGKEVWLFHKSKKGPSVVNMSKYPLSPKLVGHEDHFSIDLRDFRMFTRTQEIDALEGMSSPGLSFVIGSVPVEGTIPDVILYSLNFKKDKWDIPQAKRYVETHKTQLENWIRKAKRTGQGELNSMKRFVLQSWQVGTNLKLLLRLEKDGFVEPWLLNHPGKVGKKISIGMEPIFVKRRTKEPLTVLEFSGLIPIGKPGASRDFPAIIKILDKGVYELGQTSPGYMELFFKGTKLKGKFLIKRVENKDQIEHSKYQYLFEKSADLCGTPFIEQLKCKQDNPIVEKLAEQLLIKRGEGHSVEQITMQIKGVRVTSELTKGSSIPVPLQISGIALKEGTWNGIFYPAEEIEKAGASLIGKPLRVDHSKNVRDIVGKVTATRWNPGEKQLEFDAEVLDPVTAELIVNGLVDGVSVGVEVDRYKRPNGWDILAKNLLFQELSIVSVPACDKCKITQFCPIKKGNQ